MDVKKSTLRKSFWFGLLFTGLAFIFVSELQVTQSTTILFGDEGYWGSLGRHIANTMELPNTIDFNTGGTEVFQRSHLDASFHPLTTAGFFLLGGETLVKASSPIFAFLASLLVFIFVHRLYGLKAGTVSALVFASIPSLVTHGVILYVDILVTLLMVFSLYMLYRGLSEEKRKYLIMAGITGGLAAFTKESGFLLGLVYLVAIPLMMEKVELSTLLRKYAVVFLLFGVMVFPWYGVHNFAQFGSLGIPVISGGQVTEYTGAGPLSEASFTAQNTGGGTEAGVLQFGLLSYSSFAYGTIVFFLSIMGLALMATRFDGRSAMWLTFTLVMLIIPLYLGKGRVEDAARFALPATVGFAAAAGLFTRDIYERFQDQWGTLGRAVGIIAVISLAAFVLTSADAKAESLGPIKQFPDGFYQGCDWIQDNTAETDSFLTLWASRAWYHCERDFHWSELPDLNDIVLGDADLSYQKMQEHGIDYIYIQKFSIQQQDVLEGYPVSFVRRLQTDDRYENVYENDAVIVFEVK